MISYYASGASTSVGQWLGTGGVGLAVGIALICAGRYQRRRGRSTPEDGPGRRQYLMLVLARPSRSWYTAAKFYTRVGWLLAVCSAVLLLEEITGVLH